MGIEGFVTPIAPCGIAPVVAHKQDDGVFFLAILTQPLHQVAETLVHTLDERGIGSLLVRHTLAHVFGKESHIPVDGDVHGIMRHVEEKGLTVFLGLVEGFHRLTGEGFGQKSACPPIGL